MKPPRPTRPIARNLKKACYLYLDSTPAHSCMKYLYKDPHSAYPYRILVGTNRRRGRNDFEHELLDTGIFDAGRCFDVFVGYAESGPEDLLIKISVANRGPEVAPLHVLPTLWFRDTWSGTDGRKRPGQRT
jgi:hypothetical protein